jgi:hypothetical protein
MTPSPLQIETYIPGALRLRLPGEYNVLKATETPAAATRRRRPLYRTVKARLRAKRREHARMRAGKGKIALRPRGKRWRPKP